MEENQVIAKDICYIDRGTSHGADATSLDKQLVPRQEPGESYDIEIARITRSGGERREERERERREKREN